MKFFTVKTKKLPSAAKKSLSPRKEFIAHGRERFLAAFDASALARNAHPARPAYVAMFFKAGIGVMAALCVAVGVSAYADTASVSATSPLYPLKRLDENVQLALTPAPEKPQLQAVFAVRRANEIAALQASQPSSTLIPKLTNDLNQDIQSSLAVSVGVSAAVAPAPSEANSPSAAAVGNNDSNDSNGSSSKGINRGVGDRYYGNGGYKSGFVGGNSSATVAATSAIGVPPVVGVGTGTNVGVSGSANANGNGDADINDVIAPGVLNIYCAALNASASDIFIGGLESNLALHPHALAQFDRQCASGDGGSADQKIPAGAQGWHDDRSGLVNATETTSGDATGTAATTSVRIMPFVPHDGGDDNDGGSMPKTTATTTVTTTATGSATDSSSASLKVRMDL